MLTKIYKNKFQIAGNFHNWALWVHPVLVSFCFSILILFTTDCFAEQPPFGRTSRTKRPARSKET